ncbi:hypothetical protein AWB79_04311 [Caballeronia hypogeia]|uniref:DUF3396 domain-containing protein n=1 Tax=Caballeronia hypogeia TaxID=1777140 RepID=A0A158BVP4_9BURK|nr:type VI immunity family protein [Caballeronia hypogeia]SAK74050.1 hypothetical protein AWB79_04311 [Caballeronia hypogeia]
MKTLNWNKFEITTLRGHHAAVPALCCFFYMDGYVHEIAGELARGVERYIEFVGLDSLKSYASRSGVWKPMSKRQLDKDLRHLRDFPKDHIADHIRYDAGEGGQPGGFGVHISTDVYNDLFPNQAGLMRFDLPPQWLDEHEVEDVIEFVSDVCQIAHVQSGQVGLSFKTTPGSQSTAKPEILKMLPRYFGFSPCDFSLRDHMGGHTLTAHWLNYVNDALAAMAGGEETIVRALPDCEVRKLPKGVLIRGAKLPPIGDINRKAPDLGWLPEVARILKPTRVDISTTFLGQEDFDAVHWIERMDDLYTRPWDNSDNGQEP